MALKLLLAVVVVGGGWGMDVPPTLVDSLSDDELEMELALALSMAPGEGEVPLPTFPSHWPTSNMEDVDMEDVDMETGAVLNDLEDTDSSSSSSSSSSPNTFPVGTPLAAPFPTQLL